ncbi:ankyrin repeat domain-containing protein 26 isoform X3 [Stigmatopora argus]
MKKLFSFSKKKQSPSRTPDRGNASCVGYEVKEKDLGKFHKAAWRGDVAKLEHLAKSTDVNQVDKQNRTALHLACACGNVEVVRFLVDQNVKVNLRDNQNRSALIKAVQGQHDLCASILLEHNADPNLVETEGNMALHLASSIPSISTVETLLEHDADVNAQNKEGVSPLAVAVQEGHVEIVEYLLKKGADVNILDRDQRSPLMVAACGGQISIVRILLQFHADPTLKDNKGQSAEDYAAIEGHHPCALLITEHGTQTRQGTSSPSHLGPSKIKSKRESGNASRASLSGFSVGGPATDKEVFEDNSQAESLSRISKNGGTDEWGSSEDDCESLEIEKTPPKMNLKKMLESKRGKAFAVLDKSMSASESESDNSAPRVSSGKPPNPQVDPSPVRILPKAPQMTSTPHPVSLKTEDDESSDDEGEDEDYEEEDEEEMSDDQLEGSGSHHDDFPVKDVCKDSRITGNPELRPKKEEEKSDDSEHEDHSLPHENEQRKEEGEKIKEDLLSSPSFLRGAGSGWKPKPWWSKDGFRGGVGVGRKGHYTASPLAETKGSPQNAGTTQKQNESAKWGLLLSECGGKSKEKTDLMEELGLGDFDYAEGGSDWDTSSDNSKKSLPEGTPTTIPAPAESPQSSSSEKDVNTSPKAPVAPPRRLGGDDKKPPHPQPRSKKTVPQESDKSDWDTSACSGAKSEEQQLPEEVEEGTPEVSPMAADLESPLQADKEKDETESGDFDLNHQHTSVLGNTIRNQPCPEERLDDDVQPEKLWEEVEQKKEAKGPIPSEVAKDGKPSESSSGGEWSSDEEEAEAKEVSGVDSARSSKLQIEEPEKNLEAVIVAKLETASREETSNQAEVSQQAEKTRTPDSQMTRTGVAKLKEQAEEETAQLAGSSKTPHVDNKELILFDDSTLSDVSEDEERCGTGEPRKNRQLGEMEFSEDLGELNSSSDMTTDESDFHASGHRCSSLFIQNLDSLTTDSRSMVKLQNIFHKYERSIQKAKNRHRYFADKVSILEAEKVQLKCSLDEVKDVKSGLERNQLDLQTEVTNLKFQLKQEQENGRSATMMYNTTGDKLKRTEEQRLLEVQEKQKGELALRNLELEMRILVSQKKQLEEDNGQTQTLLAQERSARTVLENLLNNHVRKQQDIEQENKRNISKSNEALSQLTEAGDRERELLQQISIFHEQLSTLRTDLESSQANSSIKQRDLQEENKTLKEQLEEARGALKDNSDVLNRSLSDFNHQTAAIKSELALAATRLEDERGARQNMAAELESLRARLAAALEEAQRSMAACSDAEKSLLREKDEHRRLQDRLSSDASSQHEAVSSLSQKLSKAEAHANGIENDAHRLKLQLTEKNLLLNTLQRENEQLNGRAKELEAALSAEKEQVSRAAARQEATKERLTQMQSESVLLRQQLEEAQNKVAAKENAVMDAQKSFDGNLADIRKDCENRLQLALDRYQDLAATAAELRENIHQLQEEKNEREASQWHLQQELADSLKKLSMCEASLEVNTRYRSDLEEEKTRLHKDMDGLKSKLEERESQCLEVEKHVNKLRCYLDEKEKELGVAARKQQEALSAAAASDAVVKQLEGTIQRLEIENVKLEAAVKQQANKIEAFQKGTQEEARVRAHLEDLVTNLQSSKMTLEEQLGKEVQKQSMLSNSAHDSQALWEELKSHSKLGLRLAELEKEKGELDSQVDVEKKKAKKVTEQKKAVDRRLEQEMERNTDLQKEIYRLRTLLKTAKRRLREVEGDFASPATTLKIDSRPDGAFNGRTGKVRDLQGELERSTFQGSLSERRLLEEEVQSLKRRVEASETEQRQLDQYRREVEETARREIHHKLQEVNIFLQSQAATQEAQDQIKAANEASLRLKIQELESELNRTRSVQRDTQSQKELTCTELERVKELYTEEQRICKSLSSDLKRTNHQLTEASSKLVDERSRSLIASPGKIPAPSGVTSSLGAPYRGLMAPVAGGQSSSVEDYLTMMQRQLDRSISRELNKASAELDVSLARMSPVGSASRVELDPVSRAKQQYLEVLKKNHEV